MIKGCDLRDYGFVEHLWTGDLVADLVATVFGVRFTSQWMGTVLRRLGLTSQRPAYRASEQDSAAVAAWRQQVYPALRRQAAQVGATVYLVTKRGGGAPPRRHPRGAGRAHPGGGGHRLPGAGEHGLGGGAARPAALPGDRGVVHRRLLRRVLLQAAGRRQRPGVPGGGQLPHPPATAVTDYVAAREGRLRLFFLPAYTPELNPDEWGWKHVKHDEIGKTTPRGPRQHVQRVHEALA